MAAPILTGTPVALALGTSATPGAQSVTVPADAQAVVVLYRTYSAGGSSLSLASSFAGTFSYDQTSGAGEHTGVAWALVSATGSQTLTPTWTNAPAEGPIFFVAFVRDISTSDWYRASGQQVFNSTGTAASVSIASATDDLVLALDSQYDAGNAIPSNPTGWTSRQTQGVNSEGGRLRTADAPGASTTTATGQSTTYSGIAAISIKAAAAPSGAVFDSAIFSAPPFDTGVAGPTIVSGSFAGAWSVANIVSATRTGAWSVRNLVSTTRSGAFSVRASVAGSAAGAWSVRNSVGGSQSAAFSVRNYATGSADGAWSVTAGTTIVTGSAGGAWSVRNLAAATFSAASSVRNAASATQAGAWSVRAAVSASRSGAWSVRNYAAGSLSAAWSVGGPVTAEWSGAWSVRGIAAGALTSAWSVLEDVPESHGQVGHGPFAPRRHAARDLRLAMSLAPRIEPRRVEPPPARVPIEVRAPAVAGSWRPAIAHACAPITPPIRLPALMRSAPMPLLRSNNVNRAN